jgi:hypothetical protein
MQRWIRRICRELVPGAKWASERRFATGKFPPRSSRPSVVFLTVHKCASVFLGNKLSELAHEMGLTPLNLEAYGYALDKQISVPLCPTGFFFGPFRSVPLVGGVPADLRPFQIILAVRDPRDTLTSLYFSVAFSHHVPPGARGRSLLAGRDRALGQDLDSFVLSAIPSFVKRFEEYAALRTWNNVHVCRYEDLVANPAGWLADLVRFLQSDVSPEFLASLITAQDFLVEAEDQKLHKRQVLPGDHARKLQPSTIAALNQHFAGVLRAFGYDGTSLPKAAA